MDYFSTPIYQISNLLYYITYSFIGKIINTISLHNTITNYLYVYLEGLDLTGGSRGTIFGVYLNGGPL